MLQIYLDRNSFYTRIQYPSNPQSLSEEHFEQIVQYIDYSWDWINLFEECAYHFLKPFGICSFHVFDKKSYSILKNDFIS